jgi:hypothetical protein
MKTITISESEYWALKDGIHRLSLQLDSLTFSSEKPPKKGAANRLRGVLKTAEPVDDKKALEDEILKKHL